MTVDQFRTIGDHCFSRATALALSCGAEPLMARHFFEILQEVTKYRVPFTEIVTNGILLNDKNISAMIDAGLSRLIVSVDGATAPVYESIRYPAKFATLHANLRLVQRLKRASNASHPVLRLNFVMMRRNIQELPALIRLADELGASQVTAQHAVIYEGCIPEGESLFHHQKLTNDVLVEAHRVAAQSGILFSAPALFSSCRPQLADRKWLVRSHLVAALGVLRQFGVERLQALLVNVARRKITNRRTFCHHPWEMMLIDLDGNVHPCVNWGTEEPLGNCTRQTYGELWSGSAYTQLKRELTGQKPLRQACRHCPALASGKVNDHTAFDQVPL